MGGWADLAPAFTWRPSQQHLLDLCTHVTDERWHLCAPPGAGKTLIGLELARRVDRPTLVLSPTTAIRDQWCEATAMFGASSDFHTTDPEVEAPLLSVTYQLLGNPGSATDELAAAARRLWVAGLAVDLGPEAAEARVTTTEAQDPSRAGRELRSHVRRLRRSLATGDDVGVPVVDLLGARTHELLDRLTDREIGCVILDECHHLLDWWALVVAALLERSSAAVVGLTATLPDPDSAREAANYQRLLGDVDAELHLAALVAEGAVAPWRDAVRLTTLTPPEQAFLDESSVRFAAELDEVLAGEDVIDWAVGRLLGVALQDRTQPTAAAWSRFWDHDPTVAVAVARWWRARGLSLPAGFEPPPGAGVDDPLDLDDRLLLLDAWLHDPAADADPERRQALTSLANRHGVSFTTAGVRWGRSVEDLVCARSAAKPAAAAEVVAAELARRGRTCRALVVVERDRAGTPPAAARAVLGEDAGTSARMLAALCAAPPVVAAGVLGVTGSGAWSDAVHADAVTAAMSLSPTAVADGATVRAVGCDIPGVVALTVEGASWGPARWLAAAEAALDDGAAQVLVATRALVGEGWDHAPLDVLVDCSEVASPTATTQLRGRAIRLDPQRPDKVASLWDVAVVHAGAPGDWQRLRRRHGHWWGPDATGLVRTGAGKVHPRLDEHAVPEADARAEVNDHSLVVAGDHEATRAAWARLDPGGVATGTVAVRPRGATRRLRTRPARWRGLASLAGVGAVGTTALAVAATSAPPLWLLAALGAAGSVAAGATATARRQGEVRTTEAIGLAVLRGLRAIGTPDLDGATVRAEVDPTGRVVVGIDEIDDDAAAAWSAALAEALGPLGTPRWLVATDDVAWRVPGAVGATRDAAERFAAAIRDQVPGARLLRAGTPEATEVVLREAARSRPEVDRALRWSGQRH